MTMLQDDIPLLKYFLLIMIGFFTLFMSCVCTWETIKEAALEEQILLPQLRLLATHII